MRRLGGVVSLWLLSAVSAWGPSLSRPRRFAGAAAAGLPGQRREDNSTARPEASRASLERVAKSLYEYAWRRGSVGSRWMLVASVSALIASKALTVAVPFVLQACLTHLIGADRKAALRATVMYCGLKVCVALASEMRSLCYAHASQEATRAYALALFDKMHALDADFHADHPTGLLSVVFSRGARGFSTLLFQILYSVLPTILELVLSATVLARRFGSALGFATCATFVAYATFTAVVVDSRVAARRRLVELDNAKSAYLVDSLGCEETVKLFDNARVEAVRLDRFVAKMVKTFVESAKISCLLNVGQTAIFAVGLGVCLLKASAKTTQLSIGDIVAVNALLLQLAQPMNFLGYTVSEIRQSLVDMRLTEQILARPLKAGTEGKPGAALMPDEPPAVIFRGVSKRYGDQGLALDDVSFTCPSGGVTVLVGGSGCGKSTALRLITRLDEPNGGSIALGYKSGIVDAADVPLRELRAATACVPQDVRLFDESIKWNVLYGNVGADDATVAKAMAAAKLDAAHFANGADTVVGERAGRISGGERQRVGIARALIRRPRLLVADEPTSAADAPTEQLLLSALCDASPRRTVVLAAHRLTSLAPRADHIVVFKAGRVAQTGTHKQLLADDDGEYARLWRASIATDDDAVDEAKKQAAAAWVEID